MLMTLFEDMKAGIINHDIAFQMDDELTRLKHKPRRREPGSLNNCCNTQNNCFPLSSFVQEENKSLV
jgi:hypothetical protein